MDWKREMDKPFMLDGDGRPITMGEALRWTPEERKLKLQQSKSAAAKPPGKMRAGLLHNQITEMDENTADYEITSPNRLYGSHANTIPFQSATAGPRVFYGARFVNQALPLVNAEAPLVQALSDEDETHRSFDEILGKHAGARFAKKGGKVLTVDPDFVELLSDDGETERIDLYNNFHLNRKTALHNKALVKPGDVVTPGGIVAKSNYTDDKGTLALGLNARVGMVPYMGKTMDDAVAISESFAKRLTSDQMHGLDMEFKKGIKGGKNHHISVFPNKFKQDQLKRLDDEGVIQTGMTVNPGDPLILATKPRIISSASAQLGKLSSHMKNSRQDATVLWEAKTPGIVTDVARTRNGVKVNVRTMSATGIGDKIVFRSGNKGVVSVIIPDEEMPRTADGKPLEVLANPLGLPSRVNVGLMYEVLLGKLARKTGNPYKLPQFNKPSEKWYDFVQEELTKNGMNAEEEVFDPKYNQKLENPITVGDAYILKLHHTSDSKMSARGQGAYTCFDAETQVLSDRGWLNWDEVTLNDKLATVYSNTLKYEHPLALHCHDYDGELIGFEGRYVDYLVTPNHRHWVKFSKSASQFRLVSAEDLEGRSFRLRQFGFNTAGKNPDKFQLAAQTYRRKDGRKHHCRGFECSFEDYAELVGWWISEGSAGSGSNRSKSKILIHQKQAVNPDNFKRIESLFERLGLRYWTHKNVDKEITAVIVNHRVLAEHLVTEFGSSSTTKRLTSGLLQTSKNARSRLFDSLMRGDGSATGLRYHTSSQRLADEVQILSISLGRGGIVYSEDAGYMTSPTNGKVYPKRTAYSINVGAGRKIASVENYTNHGSRHYRKKYTGKVYCATMPNGLLYVRRQGKPLLTGNSDQQPLHGGGDMAKSKRLSGLESHALLSSGAYSVLREGATLRGQKNDEYWRMWRQGHTPKDPGSPFIWDKFKALLSGSGYMSRRMPGGVERLTFYSNKDLDAVKPIEVKNGELVDLSTLEPVKDGLFDPSLSGNNAWGYVKMPFEVPNPAAEETIRKLLGMTEKEYRAVMAGDAELPPHVLTKLKNVASDRPAGTHLGSKLL